jgi:hypothetical protein
VYLIAIDHIAVVAGQFSYDRRPQRGQATVGRVVRDIVVPGPAPALRM